MANNFLPFDTNRVNILSDEEYVIDGERLNGMAQGISRSILFNKVLFQSSAMCYALASVINSRGFNAVDTDSQGLIDGLNNAFPQSRGLPVSTIIQYTGNLSNGAPTGFLIPNGEAFNPTLYPELADAYRISQNTYTWGQVQQSDSSWWPKTPDLRASFLRMLDMGKGQDPNRQLGTLQGDAIRNITGEAGNYGNGIANSYPYSSGAMYVREYVGVPGESEATQGVSAIYGFDASRQVPTATENRPYNAAVNYLIVAVSGFNTPDFSGIGPHAELTQVTIATTDWDAETKQATKTVNKVLPNSNVDMGLPVPTTLENSQAVSGSGIVITTLGTDSITFTCSSIPTVDITIVIKNWS